MCIIVLLAVFFLGQFRGRKLEAAAIALALNVRMRYDPVVRNEFKVVLARLRAIGKHGALARLKRYL